MEKINKYFHEIVIVVSTLFFGLCGHAYIFLNGIFSHDATRIYQNDYLFQISLGRYIQPLYLLIRGSIQAPFLIGMLALIYLSIAIIFINKVFNFKKITSLILLCGLLSVNISLTLGCASYLPWVDVYMFCFMLCSISLFLFVKDKLIYKVIACFLIVITIGMYQPYFAVIATLMLIYCIYLLINKNNTKYVFFFGLKALLVLFISLVIYYGLLQIVLNCFATSLSSGTNSIASVGDYSSTNIISLLIDTYIYPIKHFINPNTYNKQIIRLINLILFVISVFNIVKLIKNNSLRKFELLLIVVLLLAIPLCINCIYIISKGLVHELVIYSFNLIYLLVLIFYDLTSNKLCDKALIVSLVIVILSNIIYSNQTYLKKDLEYKSTQSLCTRIMDRVEQLDEYNIGITPVTFVGEISKSPLLYERNGFEHIGGVGITDEGTYAITYDLTEYWFFNEVMGFNINYIEPYGYQDLKEVKEMPVFPEKGSIKIIGGVVVIKLSY